jgi:beta-lactamase regulating signal transducer with metallopeptidase domain/predicted transcriptional regulator
MTVQQKLKRELAYTTVQTMLNILHKKGKAKRTLKDRAYFYKPAVSRKQVVSKHVIDVVDPIIWRLSGESGYELAGNEHLTPAKLARLQKLIAKWRRNSMRNSSQLLLTFLLNACWQIALVAALASFSSWLLRNSAARYRHWIWVAALLLSLGIPVTTSWQILTPLTATAFQTNTTEQPEIQPLVSVNTAGAESRNLSVSTEAFLLNRTTAIVLLSIYFAIVLFSLFRLLQAWATTKRLQNGAVPLSGDEHVEEILTRCSNAIMRAGERVEIRASTAVTVPVTTGAFDPIVILPERLLSEHSDELLTSAIGHEIIHIRRRDYAFNLVYELLYLPLSFHPCAALIRRRIRQTRELSCDEVVAERIMTAEVYARSLVKIG